jgi:two-component system, OmpR family, phosphate regulon sensor histidine kinase PhoR
MHSFSRPLAAALLTAVVLLLVLQISRLADGGDDPAAVAVAALALAVAILVAVLLRRWSRSERAIEKLLHDVRKLTEGEQSRASESSEDVYDAISVSMRRLAATVAQAESGSVEQRAVFNEILDGMSEALIAIDHKGRVVLANRELRELFELTSDPTGRSLVQTIRVRSLIDAFGRALGGMESAARAAIESRGRTRHVEMRVRPMAASRDIAAVALLIDVTQIERLQSIRRDFLADFSHEVRTPLAGLRLAVDRLATRPDESESDQLLRIIGRQLGRLERLISEAAQLSEIESGEVVLYREPTELLSLLSDLRDELSERAGERGVSLEVTGEPLSADVDPVKIFQLFSNLVDNALRHAGASAIRINVGSAEGMAQVSVEDDGRGIAPGEQERIFHRFYRVDKSRSLDPDGTGLGLAIAKHLVHRHGGTISVESTPGRGARFIVGLPLSASVER